MASVDIAPFTEPNVILGHEELPDTGAERVSSLTKGLTPELEMAFNQALEDLDSDMVLSRWKETSPSSPIPEAASAYQRTMRAGLMALLGKISRSEAEGMSWNDAIDYCRETILSPQDSEKRASSYWLRSHSELLAEYRRRFGPDLVTVAKKGCAGIINDHFGGNPLSIAHSDKKVNFQRYNARQDLGAAFYPESSPLVVGCYHICTMLSSVVMSAWASPATAVAWSYINHVPTCDDYYRFTADEFTARIRMIALAVGVIYEYGGQSVNSIVDSSAMKGAGTGDGVTLEGAMAWRVVNGGATTLSGYTWGVSSLEDGLIGPELAMAMHDILDWRSDVAGRNHENGICVAHGLGIKDPFHTYLEVILQRAMCHPLSAAYAMAAVFLAHFTSSRYGAYLYRGANYPPCQECERLLRLITAGANLQWAPKHPPRSFSEGEPIRQMGRRLADRYEEQPLAQETISWLQYLIATGEIRMFDVFVDIDPVDATADWV